MHITKKFLGSLLIILLICTGCSLPGGGAVTEAPLEIPNLSGTWSGTVLDNLERQAVLVIVHNPPAQEISGYITITFDELVESYDISGTFDGETLLFLTSNGLYYTMSYSPGVLDGYIAWDCYNCSNQAQGTVHLVPGAPLPPVEVDLTPVDLNGNWTGSMFDSASGNTFDVMLGVSQNPGASEFSGWIQITTPVHPTYLEYYLIDGTVSGNTFQFHDTGTEVITHYFWGALDGGTINAQVSFNCYDCGDAYGMLTLTRGEGLPSLSGGPADLNGTWTGSMFDSATGLTWSVLMEVTQEAGSSEFYGTIQITHPVDTSTYEYFLTSGNVTGNTFQFHDTGTEVITHYFWGSLEGGTINAQVSLNCYDCGDAYGTMTLTR